MCAIGGVVRELREMRGWNQGQLAAFAGLHPQHVNMIESGRRENPSAETMAKLAAALRVSVDHILIEAGLLTSPDEITDLSPMENQFLQVIREIPSENIRLKTLELAIGFATVARDADAARQEQTG